jgi:hypothetical protein
MRRITANSSRCNRAVIIVHYLPYAEIRRIRGKSMSEVFAGGIDLPPAGTLRWSPQRKALVVKAVGLGAISGDEACRRYRLSPEELRGWQRAAELHGIAGLSVTRMQLLRRCPPAGRATRISIPPVLG